MSSPVTVHDSASDEEYELEVVHVPVVDDEYKDQATHAEQMFDAVLLDNETRGTQAFNLKRWDFVLPQDLIRLAWNDAGNYDAAQNLGGPMGLVQYCDLLPLPFSSLDRALRNCEDVKEECPRLTTADIIQIGARSAMLRAGVPLVDFHPGRKDALPSSKKSKFPDELTGGDFGFTHWQSLFVEMGLTNKEMVALMGGLKPAYDYDVGPHLQYNNSFFVDLLNNENSCSDANRPLLENHDFRQYVQQYAQDQGTFLADYAAVHVKISDVGLNLDAQP